MKVKTPVSVHAEALKEIIKYGAPKIEKKLRDAGHVHFAWFQFIENDTKLMLTTIYDRDFDSYLEYFALEIGPMFDLIFHHIQDPSDTGRASSPRSSWTPYGATTTDCRRLFFQCLPEGDCVDDHPLLPAEGPMIAPPETPDAAQVQRLIPYGYMFNRCRHLFCG